jgi:predicted transcriptional regulator
LEGLAWLGLLKRRSWAFKKEGLDFVYYNILKIYIYEFLKKKKSQIAPNIRKLLSHFLF